MTINGATMEKPKNQNWDERGIFTLAGSGRKFVVDCVTGKLIKLENARWIGFSKKHGGPFWIDQDGDINDALGFFHPSAPKGWQ